MIKSELIENYLKEKGISKSAFCKQCKISPSTLKKIYNNDLKFRSTVLIKLAQFMKIKVDDLLNLRQTKS